MFLGYHEENDICLYCMNGRLKYCKPMTCVCCTIHAEQAQAERDRRQEIAAALAELQASHA